MGVVLVSGSAGLIGSESVRFFCERSYTVVGLDNDMRSLFFGQEASTEWNRRRLEARWGPAYIHHPIDIRDLQAVRELFAEYNRDIELVIHTAAQPSHDWAARDPLTDFTVNANGTLNLLELTRQYCSDAVFIFCSTNKVYGDTPNSLPLTESEKRWEIDATHPFYPGVNETMGIDQSKHSLFGASKAAADLLVQEYGRYFGLRTACFRGGCLTGPGHSGTELHGFLSYLMKCTVSGAPYTVYGYFGKQVRDNLHSGDLVNAFYHFFRNPRVAEVYNIGGSRFANCSLLEAIDLCERIAGRPLRWKYLESNRVGDHIWWVSDIRKFKEHYPEWDPRYSIPDILEEIFAVNVGRWGKEIAR